MRHSPPAPGCPSCGGTSATRQGTRPRALLDIGLDGRPDRLDTVAQRWRCAACSALFTELPGSGARPRSLATVAARDAVAEACFEAGYAGAAARFGIDEKTARSLWEEWAETRRDGLTTALPERIGVHVVEVGGVERALVTDTERGAVVDLLEDATAPGLRRWLGGMEERVGMLDATIGFHPPFRDALSGRTRAGLRVLPVHARARGMRAFLSAFRTLVGDRRRLASGRGSNVRLMPRLFARPVTALDGDEREGMGAWDDAVLALYAAKERYMEALEETRPATAAAILAEVRERCLEIPGAGVPAALVAAWKDEIAAGCVLSRSDPFPGLLDTLARVWAARRPPLPFDLARGLVLLRDGPRMTEGEIPGWVLGVPMDEACRALSV